MLQPVVQFRTAIHGKSFSGSALNRIQKLWHVRNLLSVLRTRKYFVFRTDSNKLGRSALCGVGHMLGGVFKPGTNWKVSSIPKGKQSDANSR
jgi:hypothetical protein